MSLIPLPMARLRYTTGSHNIALVVVPEGHLERGIPTSIIDLGTRDRAEAERRADLILLVIGYVHRTKWVAEYHGARAAYARTARLTATPLAVAA